MCLNGKYSAFTVETANTGANGDSLLDSLIDVRDLGINSPLPYKFYRKLTCSPLRMEGHIHKFAKEDGGLCYRYFYGDRDGDQHYTDEVPDCTYELPVFLDFEKP